MRGVFLDIASLHPDDLDTHALRQTLSDWRFYDQTRPEQCQQRIRNADIVVTNKVRLDAALITSAQRLKLICVAATGTDNVDRDSARAHGIEVSNVRGYATASVTEHVFAMLLTLLRKLDRYRRAASDGSWSASRHFCVFDQPIQELAGKTLGIVGYGELGKAVARLAEAFSMRVLVAQRAGATTQAGRVPLDALLAQADILTLHCPLTDATLDLIGARELGLMKPGALLINTARGGIVNEQALVDALKNGLIAGAAVDVLAEEPPPADHPLLQAGLDNLLITPHVAWASQPARQRLLNAVAENIDDFTRRRNPPVE